MTIATLPVRLTPEEDEMVTGEILLDERDRALLT